MTNLVRLTIAFSVAILCSTTLQSQQRYPLFITSLKPSDAVIKHPASFVNVNGAAWRDAAMWVKDGDRLSLQLFMPDGDLDTLDVERFSVVDKNTPLFELSMGVAKQVPMPTGLLLRGTVRNAESSHVMLAMFESWTTGYITIERNGIKHRYLISPFSATRNSVLIVNEDIYSEQPTPWICATPDTDFPAGGKGGKNGDDVQAVNKIIRVAIEGDVEYYLDHGSDIYKCAEYAQAVVAASSDIYQRDVSAAINTPWMGFWTTTDPYTGTTSSTILTQFRTYWLANRTAVERSSATLLSGVNGIGGVANLDALCTTNGYAVSGTNNTYTYPVAGYVWDTDVMSHELGHIVGARHTHSCTWAPPIDSCYAAEGTCYTGTKAKLGTIMSYCHLTPSGTELVFHTRVSAYMITRLAARTACVLAPGTMTVGAGPDTTICTGVSVRLSGSVSGGTGPYTYFWTPPLDMTNPNALTPTVTPTKNITYVLEVRDNAGKIGTDTVKIVVGPPLSVSTPSTLTACTESEVSITATPSNGIGAYQYTWLYDDVTVHTTTPTLTFLPLFADTVTVFCLVTDSRDLCDAVDTTIVYVNRKPFVSITGPTTACRGEAIVLNTTKAFGKPPYTSAWSINGVPKALADNEVILKVDDSLNIVLVVTDANGCMDTTTHNIKMQDYTATVAPTLVQLPPIPPCADTASVRVMFTNTGTLPIVVTGSSAQILTRPLPRTIAPGATDSFDVHFTNLPTGSFTDTLKFTESTCSRIYRTVVKGQRNGVRIATPLPLVVGPFVACLDTNVVDYSFTIANDAGVAVTLNLPEGPVVLPALSDTLIRRSVRDVFVDTLTLDTFQITYGSGQCQGSMTVPLKIRSSANAVVKPDSIAFGSVFNDVFTPTTQSFQLKSTLANVPFVLVDSVDVSAPFTTALKKGQRLNTGVAHSSSVTFTLGQSAPLGDIKDTLRIRFAGCAELYEVPLSASVIITDISDDQVVAGSTAISYRDGAVLVRVAAGAEFSVDIMDIQGRAVFSSAGRTSIMVDANQFASGVYTVRVQSSTGVSSRTLMIAQ